MVQLLTINFRKNDCIYHQNLFSLGKADIDISRVKELFQESCVLPQTSTRAHVIARTPRYIESLSRFGGFLKNGGSKKFHLYKISRSNYLKELIRLFPSVIESSCVADFSVFSVDH